MHLLLAIALFRAPGFPTVDAPAIPDRVLEQALAGIDVVPIDKLQDAQLLILPYGSAFPLEEWPNIRAFLKHGGNLVVLGGSPFEQPVIRGKLGIRSPAYARELLIGPAEALRVKPEWRFGDSAWSLARPTTVWELTVRLATKAMAPDDGSQGVREGVVHPLVHLVDRDNIPRACPLVEIDRLVGRWIFATSDAPLDAATIRAIVERAMQGAAKPETPEFVYDSTAIEKLRATSPRMAVSRDWMRRDGKVFPIIGTTYMASDVHREFLFEPNPELWDRDFALMQRLGINFVRTGLWTGWSRVDENALRALEMYVAAAAKHDIIVCFTFFAFQPPRFGGSNPFLDPQSLAGQEEFIDRIAKRFRGVGWIQYDLINEPSYSPPDKLWTNQPVGDEWERRAWTDWVHEKYGDDPATLRNVWQEAGDRLMDIDLGNPRKAFDFVLFSQDVLTRWAARLRAKLPGALVTLGQDEGGTGLRSSQQLHAESIDYTSTHPWWQNDDVLATGVFAKVPEKPMLFEETGLMRLEDENGRPWRSPDLAASILERKFADAFAARGAGAIEWAWNINPYMPIDNESVIGFFRPDGTAKPELDVIPKFARFFRVAAPYLDDFAPDPTVVVIPQSRIFMNDPAALEGYKRLIRILAERFAIVPAAISDLRLTKERLQDAKHVLEVGGDKGVPVELHEMTNAGWATFDRNLRESVRKTDGRIPLEFGREDAPLVTALSKTLGRKPIDGGVVVRYLEAPKAKLAIFVNETSTDLIRDGLTIPAGRSRLVLYDRAGNVIADSEAPRIAVDQAGYPATAPKLAAIVGSSTPFSITANGAVVLDGKLSPQRFDANSGDLVRTADFSSLGEGRYELHAGGASAPIEIAKNPYADALRLALRAYHGQRCGTAVDLGHGYTHPACHLDSDHPGGWHDAGDYGRYVVNSAISTATLLWAHELFGLDALDEIRWNVDWMLSMQDQDGSVWHKETSADFADFVMPQDDHRRNFAIGKSTCAAADFAAVMAIAARAYHQPKMLAAAKRAWAWTSGHPNVTFHNPPDIQTGEYGDDDCSDERLWAAASLSHEYFVDHAEQAIDAIRPDEPPSWKHVGALAAWSYALGAHDALADRIRKRTIDVADAIVSRAKANPYRIPMLAKNFEWGSNGVAANYAMLLLIADRFRPNRAYVQTALDIIHYLLGRNTFAMSFVTGVGERSVMRPHHRPSAADGIDAPWPGLLAGGPNRNRQDPALRRLPGDVPPARAYVDETESFASNEVAINWNAPLVFDLAAIAQKLQGDVRPESGTLSLK